MKWMQCAILVAVSLLAGFIAVEVPVAQAAPALEFKVGDLTAVSGSTVQVPVVLASEGNIAAIQFDLSFDERLLTIQKTEPGKLTANFSVMSNLVDGKQRVLIFNLTGTSIPAGTGAVAVLTFQTKTKSVSQANCKLGLSGVVLADTQGRDLTSQAVIHSSQGGTAANDSLPIIGSTAPAKNATGVPLNQIITIIFNKDVQQGANYATITVKDAQNKAVTVSKSLSGATLTLTPGTGLTAKTKYTVTVPAGAVRDASGNTLKSSYSFSFTTRDTQQQDMAPPVVKNSDPAKSATGVPLNQNIAVTFSKEVWPGAQYAKITVKGAQSKAVTVSKNLSGATLTLTPGTGLTAKTRYTVTVPAGAVRDAAGNTLKSSYSFSFTTRDTQQQDMAPPVVKNSDPANGAAGVPLDGAVTVTFNANVKSGSAYSRITVRDDGNRAVSVKKVISNNVLRITPYNKLAEATNYHVDIPAGAVKDAAGNSLNAPYAFTFMTQTGAAPGPVTFKDVRGHWAAQSIASLTGKGLVSGYADGTFKPENKVNRAEITAMLVRAAKLASAGEQQLAGLSNQFADASAIPTWARGAVATAVWAGLVKGFPQADGTTTFMAGKPVSRAELAALTARIANDKLGPITPAALNFKDAARIPSWAKTAVGTAVARNIVGGYGDQTFRAENPVTRAEAAAMILRLVNLMQAG